MPPLDAFTEIIKPNERLAPYTYLRLGGPAEKLAQPRSREELSALVQCCFQERIPLRVLGSGCSVLVRDEGVPGLVLREEGEVVVLADTQGKEVRVAKSAIDDRTVSQTSPMPANFVDQVPEADFYNLLAFLLAQRPPKQNGPGGS